MQKLLKETQVPSWLAFPVLAAIRFPLSASHFPKAQQWLDLHLENLQGYASMADQPGHTTQALPSSLCFLVLPA